MPSACYSAPFCTFFIRGVHPLQIPSEQSLAEEVKYLLSDQPEFIDIKPIYQVINAALKK